MSRLLLGVLVAAALVGGVALGIVTTQHQRSARGALSEAMAEYRLRRGLQHAYPLSFSCDLDQDGSQEAVGVVEGRLHFEESADGVQWTTPLAWWADTAVVADVDADGTKELALLVWKEGSYGSSQPFWIKENDTDIRQHLFLYRFAQNAIVPFWHSSALARPNCTMRFQEDAAQLTMVVGEGSYDDAVCTTQTLGLWQWNGWGFSLIERKEPAKD